MIQSLPSVPVQHLLTRVSPNPHCHLLCWFVQNHRSFRLPPHEHITSTTHIYTFSTSDRIPLSTSLCGYFQEHILRRASPKLQSLTLSQPHTSDSAASLTLFGNTSVQINLSSPCSTLTTRIPYLPNVNTACEKHTRRQRLPSLPSLPHQRNPLLLPQPLLPGHVRQPHWHQLSLLPNGRTKFI